MRADRTSAPAHRRARRRAEDRQRTSPASASAASLCAPQSGVRLNSTIGGSAKAEQKAPALIDPRNAHGRDNGADERNEYPGRQPGDLAKHHLGRLDRPPIGARRAAPALKGEGNPMVFSIPDGDRRNHARQSRAARYGAGWREPMALARRYGDEADEAERRKRSRYISTGQRRPARSRRQARAARRALESGASKNNRAKTERSGGERKQQRPVRHDPSAGRRRRKTPRR